MAWCRKAADQGYAAAQLNPGLSTSMAGAFPNYVQAHKWFNLTASRFAATEKENRDKAVQSRDSVAAKMTTAQVAEAQRLVREWKPAK